MIIKGQNRFLYVNVIGAGLAGCEASLYLANHGIKVNLFDMKPRQKTPAHKSNLFAELVCSNSLKSKDEKTASGLLKLELNSLNSQILKIANQFSVPAGHALAVDREKFSQEITNQIKSNKNINFISTKITKINLQEPTIIATGPLTDDELYKSLQEIIGVQNCYFYDAIAPIIQTDSIDFKNAFYGNRYGKGDSDGDYINCTLNKDEYEIFHKELICAKTVELKEFEKVFEGCMPVEVLAKRGFEALRFGPMKPVGLFDKQKNERPYAVLQLRKENESGSFVNMVGFQTNLLFDEQKRVFSLIPSLKNAIFSRFGQMHRNCYVNAPSVLDEFSRIKNNNNIFIAGQLSGTEGYVESIASGLYVAMQMKRYIEKKPLVKLMANTLIGAMMNYLANSITNSFVPTNANYGILITRHELIKDKNLKRELIKADSLKEIEKFKEKINGN